MHSYIILHDKFEKMIIERDSHEEALGDDVSSHENDNNIFLDVVGGVNKKGHIYDLGSEAGKCKSYRSSRSDDILQSEFEQTRGENASLKEQLKTCEELIRASQENSLLLREQMIEFMEIVSQVHLHPPPPSLT
ncbi:hypothetical protein MtrunA17_Chr1g0189031 [Medicago truncatula]|uniref:Uncharacterized protein n=1 Tax=Medicago truncatula TaxID=3880 RepID=A0A396JQE3_MEDTR|nr:hypothetical protein MtrunA17_Chr1g0189031 [Medicago truncatula]